MKSRILLSAAVIIGLTSCSTMYRSGQTPDDVYYSPAPQYRSSQGDDYANNDNGGDGQEYVNVQTDQDRSAYNSEDNYLRMKVQNRTMWSTLDDYSMYDAMYSPYYGSGFGMGYYSPYSLYSPYSYSGLGLGFGYGGFYGGYNSFYNPYSFYSPYSFYNPYYGYGGYGSYYGGYYPSKGATTTRPAGSYGPRAYNLGTYGTRTTGSGTTANGGSAPVRVFRSNNNTYVNPSNSGRSSGSNDSPRRSYNSGSDSRPSRTFDQPRSSSPSPSYTPSPSSGGSRSSGGGGGSAPSRSPGRGGR
ncbi:MAG: hypothetical protein QM802_08575 [Agriterribacter sp.]